MPYFLEAPGSVHRRGLIQLLIDARNGGDKQDGVPARALPYAYGAVCKQPVPFFCDKGDAVPSKPADDDIDKTAFRGEHLECDSPDNNPRNKIRKVDNRLGNPFISDAFHF